MSYGPSVPSFLVGVDTLPQTFVAGHTPVQDINPTQYRLAKYVQYWVNLVLSPAWEATKTRLSITDAQMRKICPDESWSFAPLDLISLTDVDVLPRWVVTLIEGGFDNETNEEFWISETFQVVFLMKPVTDPKLLSFVQISDTIPRVIGNALKTNIDASLVFSDQSPGTLYWDKCEITLGKFEAGPVVLPGAGKPQFYHAIMMDIGIRSKMQTIYSGVEATQVSMTMTADNADDPPNPHLTISETNQLNNPWAPMFGPTDWTYPRK